MLAKNRRGVGIWLTLVLLMVVSTLLVVSLAHQRGSVTIHAMARTTVDRVAEEAALSAASEAAAAVLRQANETDSSPLTWFDALRTSQDGFETAVATPLTEALVEHHWKGIPLTIENVRARLECHEVSDEGRVSGELTIEVEVKSPAGAKTLCCHYHYYLTGNGSETAPHWASLVVLGRAPRLTIRG